eukprot:126524-Chlamydomonas_euryale.AAC.7
MFNPASTSTALQPSPLLSPPHSPPLTGHPKLAQQRHVCSRIRTHGGRSTETRDCNSGARCCSLCAFFSSLPLSPATNSFRGELMTDSLYQLTLQIRANPELFHLANCESHRSPARRARVWKRSFASHPYCRKMRQISRKVTVWLYQPAHL